MSSHSERTGGRDTGVGSGISAGVGTVVEGVKFYLECREDTKISGRVRPGPQMGPEGRLTRDSLGPPVSCGEGWGRGRRHTGDEGVYP